MDYNKELAADLVSRCHRLQKTMQAMNIEACLLSTGVNIFYMTGRIYNGYFYLPAEGKPFHFVKRPGDVDFENTIYIRKPEQITELLAERGIRLPQTLMMELDVIPYSEMTRLISIFGIKDITSASTVLRRQRSIKSDFEIIQTRGCARKHEAVYKLIPSVFKKGMTDVELQIEIERLMRLNGSIGIFRSYGENMDIYMGSLLSGKNAAAPSPYDYALGGAGTSPTLPLGASGEKLEDGQVIMIDMAGNYSPWMTDMTRTFSVGKTTEEAYRAHQVSLDIQDKIIDMAKPGTPCADLYNIAMDIVKANNLEANFMGTELQAKFVGHGVGLEINELPVLTPRSKDLLEPNIIFALEPKFVLPNVGAVGIENTFLVTESGIEKLTQFEENIIKL